MYKLVEATIHPVRRHKNYNTPATGGIFAFTGDGGGRHAGGIRQPTLFATERAGRGQGNNNTFYTTLLMDNQHKSAFVHCRGRLCPSLMFGEA